MDNKFYQELVSKMHEVTVVPPQDIGVLTPFYKMFVPKLKYAPWRSIAFISTVLVLFLYLLFGTKVISLASLLQFGF